MGIRMGEILESDQSGFMVVEGIMGIMGIMGRPMFGSFSRLGGHGGEDVCGIWG
jgi:hypothetical protein